jgi:hypothetical protein
MLLHVFTVRDSKAEAYLQPFYVPNESVARRAMTDCIEDDNHAFGKHPEDYALYALGVYDDSNGKFELLDAPQHLVNLVDLKGE